MGLAINGTKPNGLVYNNQILYKGETIKIVTFQDGTDEEIAAMLEAHYKGKINIGDYWKVGDTRIMHLNAMEATSPYADESHIAQDMVMVIIGIEHDTLKEQIGTRTKAAITLQCRETLGSNGSKEKGYYWGSSVKPSLNANYSQNPRRTWLNDTFINSMPTTFSSLIKTVIKKNLSDHGNNPSLVEISDKAFLLSYPEVFGNTSYQYYKGSSTLEGNQYSYYTTSSNRIKYVNNNGQKSNNKDYWWLRSPHTVESPTNGYCWILVNSDSNADYNLEGNSFSFSPAFCL